VPTFGSMTVVRARRQYAGRYVTDGALIVQGFVLSSMKYALEILHELGVAKSEGGIGMEVRKIRQEDIGKVVGIVNRNYDEVMVSFHTKEVIWKFKEHNTLENWQRQMTWKEIFVVEDAVNEIIATGALANFGDENRSKYCISNFFVCVERQKSGAGKLLLNHIVQLAKSKGIDTLHVPSSRSGFEFYGKMGFVKDEIQNDEIDEITWMTLKIQ